MLLQPLLNVCDYAKQGEQVARQRLRPQPRASLTTSIHDCSCFTRCPGACGQAGRGVKTIVTRLSPAIRPLNSEHL